MKLAQYLEETQETKKDFCARTGIHHTSLTSVLEGGGCNLTTAAKIVQATDGWVDYPDLVPDGAAW